MLNCNGIHTFLLTKNDGRISIIYKNCVTDMKINFVNLCNNSDKISLSIHFEVKEYFSEEKLLLYIYVYASVDIHKTANKIFNK